MNTYRQIYMVNQDQYNILQKITNPPTQIDNPTIEQDPINYSAGNSVGVNVGVNVGKGDNDDVDGEGPLHMPDLQQIIW